MTKSRVISTRLDRRDRVPFEVVLEVIINVGFGNSFSVYGDYNKCLFP